MLRAIMSVPQAVANAKELRALYDTDKLGIVGVKIHPEGVHTSHASVMLEPWTDQPDMVAVRGVSAERVEEMVLAINEAGMDLSIHVDGSKPPARPLTLTSRLKSLAMATLVTRCNIMRLYIRTISSVLLITRFRSTLRRSGERSGAVVWMAQ